MKLNRQPVARQTPSLTDERIAALKNLFPEAVTRHRSLDTLLAYAHEVDRDDDPAEAYVNYSNGK